MHRYIQFLFFVCQNFYKKKLTTAMQLYKTRDFYLTISFSDTLCAVTFFLTYSSQLDTSEL